MPKKSKHGSGAADVVLAYMQSPAQLVKLLRAKPPSWNTIVRARNKLAEGGVDLAAYDQATGYDVEKVERYRAAKNRIMPGDSRRYMISSSGVRVNARYLGPVGSTVVATYGDGVITIRLTGEHEGELPTLLMA